MRNTICAVLLALMVGPAFADVVRLVDGRRVEGEAHWVTGDHGHPVLVVSTRHGSVRFERADVDRIEHEETPHQEFERRLAKVEGESLKDRRELLHLAHFCIEHGFSRDARELALRVYWLPLDGSDEQQAAQAEAADVLEHELDCHLVEGEWIFPEDYYPAHGYVRVHGRWVHEDEALAEQERAEAAREERRARIRAKLEKERERLRQQRAEQEGDEAEPARVTGSEGFSRQTSGRAGGQVWVRGHYRNGHWVRGHWRRR